MATVFRIEKDRNFTVMSNYHLDDARLSLKAKGLLSYMLRQPDNWDYTLSGLASKHKDGVDAIRSAVNELEELGYLVREFSRDANGTFAGNNYVIREVPPSAKTDAQPEQPLWENPITENPLPENPLPENPTQPNTNIPSTNIPPIVPQGGQATEAQTKKRRKRARREPKEAPDWKPDRFNGFWTFYPRGESKQAAITAWDKLCPDDGLISTMGLALRSQMQTEDWRRGIGIPYASTWLNKRRWEDEPKKLTQQGGDNSGGWAEDEEVID